MISSIAPQSKYNAQRTGGFDSKLEERRYYQLKNDPHVVDIEVHPIFEIFPATRKCLHCKETFDLPVVKCPNIKCGRKLLVFRAIHYIADFRITYDDGRIEIEDVKGVETEAFKIKRKLFEAAYPDLTLKIVTSKDMTKERIARREAKAKKAPLECRKFKAKKTVEEVNGNAV